MNQGLLFQPLTPTHFENARNWREQQRQKYLQSLRPLDPATISHELTISLGSKLQIEDLQNIRHSKVIPWMIARFNHFPNMPNWIRIDWPACSDRKNEHKAHKIIQQVFRDLSQTPTKVQPLSCQLALCTKLSIRVPTEIWGPSSERYHFPGKEVINLSFFGFQLPYEFCFEGDFVYFDLGLQGILSPMLTVLSLTNCIICLADVMRVLEYSPNIQSCTLKKIVYYKKLPYSSLLNPILANVDNWTRMILLRSLVSLTIESNCSLTQLFHYAELPMLQSLYLSLDGNGLSDLDEYLWKDSRSRSVTIECFSSCWLGIHNAVKNLKFKNLTYVTKS